MCVALYMYKFACGGFLSRYMYFPASRHSAFCSRCFAVLNQFTHKTAKIQYSASTSIWNRRSRKYGTGAGNVAGNKNVVQGANWELDSY
jgi:hypothetical protein